MSLPRSVMALLALVLSLPGAAQTMPTSDAPDEPPSSCPVTKPTNPSYIPPSPNAQQASSESFWFGSDALWIMLPVNGVWRLGHYRPGESSYRQKMLWHREGYNARNDSRLPLFVSGKKLDGPAPRMGVDGPRGAWQPGTPPQYFMTVGLNLPSTGCWEITGIYQQDRLSFLVWVEDGSGSRFSSPGGR